MGSFKVSYLFQKMLDIFIFSQKRKGKTRTIMLVDHKQNHAIVAGTTWVAVAKFQHYKGDTVKL